VHYYGTSFGAGLTTEQKEAINGHASTGTCDMWNRLFVGGVNPTDGCPAIGAEVYNPTTNPDGARCTLQDSNVNVLGIDPDTGFARRPLDNVGIQYGLAAVNAGVISVDQFLDLNEHIGAYDIDGNVVAERTEMSEETAAHTYAVGSVIGPGPLLDVPIILRNLYTDDIGDIHTRFHVFSIRDRLQVDGEDDPNLLVWSAQSRDVAASLLGNVAGANEPIVLLDEWLSAGDRPASATNRCVLPDGQVLNGGWELYDEPGPCATAYPVHGDPRLAAGAAQREDVIKCALVPIDPSGYDVAFTDAQQTRFASVFPDGVCDWDAPGVGMRESSGPWQDYSP
jgi:hypothetical protein